MKTMIAVVMMLASAAAYGQLVKCISQDGRVEYTTQCPAGTTEHKTTIYSKGSGSAPAPAAQQKSVAEQDAAFKKRQLEQQEARQKAQQLAGEAARNREACESARNYLQTLESGMRVRRYDPKTGELVYPDDAEREAETAKARARVAQNCK